MSHKLNSKNFRDYRKIFFSGQNWKTKEEWEKIEDDEVLFTFWSEITNNPYEWHKRMLTTVPKSLISAIWMNTYELRLLLSISRLFRWIPW